MQHFAKVTCEKAGEIRADNNATLPPLLHPLFGRSSLVKRRFVALLHRFEQEGGGAR
jgi:hypothetical protein